MFNHTVVFFFIEIGFVVFVLVIQLCKQYTHQTIALTKRIEHGHNYMHILVSAN